MNERRDLRGEDRGPEARRLDLKSWLQIGAMALTFAAVLWRGGQMTEKLDSVVAAVDRVTIQVSAQQVDQATLKARIDSHDKDISNHETRIVRIENRERRER